MLLAGDIGGRKTRLALFERRPIRPIPMAKRSLSTMQFHSLGDMVEAFLTGEGLNPDRIEAACFGVAGPVLDGQARLTNVGWTVVAAAVRDRFALKGVRLLNDLEATAWSVPVLDRTELETLQVGRSAPSGNAAVIAA